MRFAVSCIILLSAASAAAQRAPDGAPQNVCDVDFAAEPSSVAELIAPPHNPVALFRQVGDWICGYRATPGGGGGPHWLLTTTLRTVRADAHPSVARWLGTWQNGENTIRMQASPTKGRLILKGEALWHGLGDNVHVGEFSGEATPDGNRMRFVQGGGESCEVNFTLFGKYLFIRDNESCGGANVRFWGVWKKRS